MPHKGRGANFPPVLASPSRPVSLRGREGVGRIGGERGSIKGRVPGETGVNQCRRNRE